MKVIPVKTKIDTGILPQQEQGNQYQVIEAPDNFETEEFYMQGLKPMQDVNTSFDA